MPRACPPPYTEHGPGYVYSPISDPVSKKLDSGISAWLDATSYMYMDHQNIIEDEQRQQIRARSQNRLSEQFFSTTRQASQVTTLPQRQWQEVPIPYRPREWDDCSQERLPPRTSTPPHVPPFRQFQQQLAYPVQPVQPLRLRRRPQALTSTPNLQQFESHASEINPALLYPQVSPYDEESTFHTPDEPQHYMRSVSQPNTPSFLAYRGHTDEPDAVSLTGIPRSPTFPPARLAPQHTTTEAPFTDDEEFHLFVQATAGLGPEQPLRGSPTIPSYQEERRRSMMHGREQQDHLPLVSPIQQQQQTSTTMPAMQHMAQMPQPAFTLPRRPTPQRLMTEPIHASDGGLDLWVEHPSADVSEGDVSPIEEEDELPGYAESQAQAQAVQATEARRRAQELARRWQQAHQ